MGRKKKTRHTCFMAHHVKSARKAQGNCRCGKTIRKGDEYYWHKNRYGPKKVRCTEHPFRRSETVSSDKLSTLYAAQESLEDAISAIDSVDDAQTIYDDLKAALENAASEAENVAEEYQSGFDNMPDGLQNSATGEAIQEKIDACREWADVLSNAASSLIEYEGDDDDADENDADEAGDEDDGRNEKLDAYKLSVADEVQAACDALEL